MACGNLCIEARSYDPKTKAQLEAMYRQLSKTEETIAARTNCAEEKLVRQTRANTYHNAAEILAHTKLIPEEG